MDKFIAEIKKNKLKIEHSPSLKMIGLTLDNGANIQTLQITMKNLVY